MRNASKSPFLGCLELCFLARLKAPGASSFFLNESKSQERQIHFSRQEGRQDLGRLITDGFLCCDVIVEARVGLVG